MNDQDDAEPGYAPDDDHQEEHAARHLDRLAGALAALDDDVLRRALASLNENNRLEVAAQLQLPRAAMHLGEALVPLARRKLRVAAPARQLSVAFSLTEPVNEATIAALGPRHEDPSRADLDEVLPGVIEQFGTPWVTVMLSAYAASDAPCQAVMAELLDSDERLAIGEAVPVDEADDQAATTAPTARDDAAQVAKREQRKAAKEARRAAETQKQAARAAAEARRREAQRAAKRRT